jgi:translation initiation factor 2 subunit 1
MAREEWPEKGELVICSVKELKSFGAFVSVEEYGGKEGLIHISEVSSGWVKHLRDYVREEQKVVCKVLFVDARRGHIDLSLKVVTDGQKRERIKEWKNEKKAKKWLSLALADPPLEISSEEFAEIEQKLFDAYGSLYDAFEDVVKVGKGALISLGIDQKHADAICKVADSNVKLPYVQIAGYVELTCPLYNGVEIIKEALINAEDKAAEKMKGKENTKVECFYIGAPRYKIRVTASNYKEAENTLSDAADTAVELIKKNGGQGSFYRNLP